MSSGIVLAMVTAGFAAGLALGILISSGNVDVNMGIAAKSGGFVNDGKLYLVTPARTVTP